MKGWTPRLHYTSRGSHSTPHTLMPHRPSLPLTLTLRAVTLNRPTLSHSLCAVPHLPDSYSTQGDTLPFNYIDQLKYKTNTHETRPPRAFPFYPKQIYILEKRTAGEYHRGSQADSADSLELSLPTATPCKVSPPPVPPSHGLIIADRTMASGHGSRAGKSHIPRTTGEVDRRNGFHFYFF